MRKGMPGELVLPVIYVQKGKFKYELHWDYQGTEAELVLSEKNEYLTGYINGCLDALCDEKAVVCCCTGETGTVKNLGSETAYKLKNLLENLLFPMVEQRFKKLKKFYSDAYIRYQLESGNPVEFDSYS